jgi:threo-3-hydroxy-L-aspartate ammonia-lyase
MVQNPKSKIQNPKSPMLPTYSDITTAADRLQGKSNLTPVLTSRTINQLTQSQVFLKCENFQRTGSFKFRGAYNALSQLNESDRARGVLAFSSGNHAQGIALAGKLLNISTRILMPQDAPAVKLEATRNYGAEVELYDRRQFNREEIAKQLIAESGRVFIPPYDHAQIIAGQGTTAYELIQTVGELDLLLVCCGGGGLLSGCAIATRHLSPNCRIIGVEPEAADDATRSFYSKTLQTVENPPTIADGARTPYLGKLTFPLVLEYVDDMVTVSDAAIVRSLRFLWERLKIIVEPTGALAIAALLEGKVDVSPHQKVGVVISGGNVDLATILPLMVNPSVQQAESP